MQATTRLFTLAAVFAFSALTVLAVALLAPIALCLSAILRVAAPVRRRGRWRLAQPA
ncbi:MAG: hypothetical protein K2Q06_13080 [Parvularculaceae bacterium]|nr:hypothetical protein [Parvularculaceae bacterium]